VTTDLGKAIQRLMAADVPIIVQQFPAGGPNQVQPIDGASGLGHLAAHLHVPDDGPERPGLLRVPAGDDDRHAVGLPVPGHVAGARDEGNDGVEDASSNKTEVYFGAFAHAVIGEALGLMVDATTEGAYYDGSRACRRPSRWTRPWSA
jgi:hypothetical protein